MTEPSQYPGDLPIFEGRRFIKRVIMITAVIVMAIGLMCIIAAIAAC